MVDISDPDIRYGAFTADSIAPWSNPEELRDKVLDPPARYATLEPGRWILDQSFQIFPSDYQVSEPIGHSNDIPCGKDGRWPEGEPAWVQTTFSNVSILQALSLFFSTDPADGIPVDFTVEVLVDGVAYYTKIITGNTATEITLEGFTVLYAGCRPGDSDTMESTGAAVADGRDHSGRIRAVERRDAGLFFLHAAGGLLLSVPSLWHAGTDH